MSNITAQPPAAPSEAEVAAASQDLQSRVEQAQAKRLAQHAKAPGKNPYYSYGPGYVHPGAR